MKVIEFYGLTELNDDGFNTIRDYLDYLNIRYLQSGVVFIIDDESLAKLNIYDYDIVVYDSIKGYLD